MALGTLPLGTPFRSLLALGTFAPGTFAVGGYICTGNICTGYRLGYVALAFTLLSWMDRVDALGVLHWVNLILSTGPLNF